MTSPNAARISVARPIQLLQPREERRVAIFTAFEQRETTREIAESPLRPQLLSNLLWAAYGVNRVTGPFGRPGRTAASAGNSQEIELFVALREGVYRYDGIRHQLWPVVAGDYRDRAQAKAPVQLIFGVDLHRLASGDPEMQKAYYYVDTGLIAANVYLFAAAYGLAAWFHDCDRSLARDLGLGPEQKILFAQSVGYPL